MSLVAIDGQRGTGKSQLAGNLRDHFGCRVLEIGPVFRLIAWLMYSRSLTNVEDTFQPLEKAFETEFIRLDPLSSSRISAMRIEIRGHDSDQALWQPVLDNILREIIQAPNAIARVRDLIRCLAHGDRVAVIGREAGVEFFPDASLKLFLEAKEEVRTLRKRRQTSKLHPVLCDTFSVDSPERATKWKNANGVLRLDTTQLTSAEVFDCVSRLIHDRLQWHNPPA
ncbi:MAG TPA: (d)CMP kinase [Candidatus Angelobacter sp.]|nr:(d)CMP kinase [Candidatus Angelobacter sp.]